MIAALYVATNGCYYGLPGVVDPWDEARDARLYAGPWPVVAHPPCQRWGKLWAGQPLWIKRTGERKVKGDDGGCFAAALNAARTWGGVIEHPWGKPPSPPQARRKGRWRSQLVSKSKPVQKPCMAMAGMGLSISSPARK